MGDLDNHKHSKMELGLYLTIYC